MFNRWSFNQTFSFNDKVILKENEADDGEKVDQDDGQEGSEEDGTKVFGHTIRKDQF